ncbi:MAG: hypothetical protein JNL90_18235 [Planctomycetes bacterium]|nr:hypothetical protein [Planctomycetota bacterium]
MTAPTPWPKRIWLPAAIALAAWLAALAERSPEVAPVAVARSEEPAAAPIASPLPESPPEPPRELPPAREPEVVHVPEVVREPEVSPPVEVPAEERAEVPAKPPAEPPAEATAAVPAAVPAEAPPATPLEVAAVETAPRRAAEAPLVPRVPLPAGYAELAGAAALPAAYAALGASFSARLGAARDDYAWSGAALAPWVVVAPRTAAPDLEPLRHARRRLEAELLAPLEQRLANATPVAVACLDADRLAAQGGTWREVECLALDAASARAVSEALAAATLVQLLGESAPRWWRDGAAAWIAADSADALFAAVALAAPLAPLFRRDGEPCAAGVAGAFAAWCLDPLRGGGAHARASFLETPRLRGAPEGHEELAARFGCAHFAELEQRWRSALAR